MCLCLFVCVCLFVGLPHYQVQDQQEAVRPTSATTKRPDSGSKEKAGDGEEVKKSFKPLYQSPRTQPCQCSACIGAVATVICPVSGSGRNYASMVISTSRLSDHPHKDNCHKLNSLFLLHVLSITLGMSPLIKHTERT